MVILKKSQHKLQVTERGTRKVAYNCILCYLAIGAVVANFYFWLQKLATDGRAKGERKKKKMAEPCRPRQNVFKTTTPQLRCGIIYKANVACLNMAKLWKLK